MNTKTTAHLQYPFPYLFLSPQESRDRSDFGSATAIVLLESFWVCWLAGKKTRSTWHTSAAFRAFHILASVTRPLPLHYPTLPYLQRITCIRTPSTSLSHHCCCTAARHGCAHMHTCIHAGSPFSLSLSRAHVHLMPYAP